MGNQKKYDENCYLTGLKNAAEYIMKEIRISGLKETPAVAVILGSGLGAFADCISGGGSLNYAEIPGFVQTTVKGHEGRLIWGRVGKTPVIAMKGRFHYYEGHDMAKVVSGVRIMKLCGIKGLLVTNAAGGTGEKFLPGDLMLIKDHLGMFTPSPLRGNESDYFGPRFPDMSEPYSERLMRIAQAAALEEGIDLKKGIYAYMQGPSYETPAEIRALSGLGADAVGMSTVPEVIAARHAGIEVIGISCITNSAAGTGDKEISHDDVMSVSGKVENTFVRLVAKIISMWPG